MTLDPKAREERPDAAGAGATTAQVAGDIQAGRTGDRSAGFDPAAAPLGTDDEAAGKTFSPAWIAKTRILEGAGRPNTARAHSASPQMTPDARKKDRPNLAAAALCGVVLAAIVFGVLFLAVRF